QCAILRRAVIEVKAQRDHPCQQSGGRLHVGNAVLHRPWAEASHVASLLHGDGEILMPGDFPICAGRLIEEQRANDERRAAEDLDGELYEARMLAHLAYSREAMTYRAEPGQRFRP